MILKNIPLTVSAIALAISILVTAQSCIPISYSATENYTDIEYRTEYRMQTVSENKTVITTEDLSRLEISPAFSWFSQEVAFNSISNIRYYAYDLPDMQPYDNILIRVYIQRPFQYEEATFRLFDMTGAGHIDTPEHLLSPEYSSSKGEVVWNWFTGATTSSWLDRANIKMNKARFLGGRSNLWSKDEYPQLIEFNADKASKLAVIVTGPLNQWNSSITLTATWQKYHESYITMLNEKEAPVQVSYGVTKQRNIILNKDVPFWEILLGN